MRDILDQRGYIKLKSIRLQGLLLSVFTLKKHLLNVREIESEYTRTGLAGMWVSYIYFQNSLSILFKISCRNKVEAYTLNHLLLV